VTSPPDHSSDNAEIGIKDKCTRYLKNKNEISWEYRLKREIRQDKWWTPGNLRKQPSKTSQQDLLLLS
jgi:hypothetical protein